MMKRFSGSVWGSYLTVAVLACLMGVSYELFVFPNAFAPAGINGLATMLQYLLHVNIGYLSLLINLPLILLAWKKVDPDFARKTLAFVLVFSAVTLVLGHMALEDGQIGPVQGVGLDLLGQAEVAEIVFGHQEQAGGILIDAVDDAGA